MGTQKDDAHMSWAKFLNPESLKGNLITASLFLTAFESLKSSAIDQIREFFTIGLDENDATLNHSYQQKVLSLNNDPFRASLLWLKESGVLSEDDLTLAYKIRKHRNELAHELQKFIMTFDLEINVHLLGEILRLVTKIDRWWILEFEVPSNPDFDGCKVDSSDVHSGRMLFLEMMMQIATGEAPTVYWETFQRLSERSGTFAVE